VKERRYTSDSIEIRGLSGAGARIAGHASMFDTPYDLGFFRERVARGAFVKTMGEAAVAALWNHDPNIVLGRNKNKTLRLEEDEVGLAYEFDLPDTQAARDLYALIERGDVYQSSFSFETIKDYWMEPDASHDQALRTLTEVRLWDVSPVTYPASPTTDVDVARAMRSLATVIDLPFDELVDVAQKGALASLWTPRDSATTPAEPEAEPREHSESTPAESEPQRDRTQQALDALALLEVELKL
jgi:HK97 family phage prohead protease